MTRLMFISENFDVEFKTLFYFLATRSLRIYIEMERVFFLTVANLAGSSVSLLVINF